MNLPSSPAEQRRADAPTAFALAAGLSIGHVVAAMADLEGAGDLTLASALVFVVAASGSTLCALAKLVSKSAHGGARSGGARWIIALGAGLLAALASRHV